MTCATINGRVSLLLRDQAYYMDGSIVCIGCAVSTLPRIGIEATARDKMNHKRSWREVKNAALHTCGATFEISFGVWRGLPRLHFFLLVLLMGGVGRITGNTTGWLCDTLRQADYYAAATMRAPKLPSKEYTGFMHFLSIKSPARS